MPANDTYLSFTRISDTEAEVRINGSVIDSFIRDSGIIPAGNMFIGAQNSSGTANQFYQGAVSLFWSGGIPFIQDLHYANITQLINDLSI
jgi:hypothetical protein